MEDPFQVHSSQRWWNRGDLHGTHSLVGLMEPFIRKQTTRLLQITGFSISWWKKEIHTVREVMGWLLQIGGGKASLRGYIYSISQKKLTFNNLEEHKLFQTIRQWKQHDSGQGHERSSMCLKNWKDPCGWGKSSVSISLLLLCYHRFAISWLWRPWVCQRI